MKTFQQIASLALTLCLAGAAMADGIAVIKGEDSKSTMRIEYKDQNKIRMESPGDMQGYMLTTGDNAYMIADVQGQTMVMDLRKMAQMARSIGGQEQDDEVFDLELLEIESTGKQEKIAGYQGSVYRMKWKDKKGIHENEVVLSEHPDVVDFSNSWMHMANTMAASISSKQRPKNSIGAYLREHKLGLLRMGDDFIVVSIQPGAIDAQRFAVPKSTFQMPAFGN